MLIVGDIHINYRYQHDILDELKKTIQKFPDEEHIIFLGDYVYHFSYDRVALLALYEYWIALFNEGKKVYVLAGNHDRIGNSFVYEEGQRAFNIIKNLASHKGKIFFITQPEVHRIKDREVVFFPYALEYTPVDIKQYEQQYPDLVQEITTLIDQKEKNIQISAQANALLLKYVVENPDALIIHHHYIDGVVFPGEKSRFSYKNIALSKQFLDIKNIQLISGHLHQGFCYKNYLCTGSIWNTSSLETNQIKGIYRYTDKKREKHNLWVNPYFSSEYTVGTQRGKKQILNIIQNMYTQEDENFNNTQQYFGKIHLDHPQDIEFPWKKVTLYLTANSVDYEHIDEYINSEFRQELRDVKLKKNKFQSLDIKNLTTLYDRKNLNTFSDRKSLLKDFLKTKYTDEYEQYLDFLVKHKIL